MRNASRFVVLAAAWSCTTLAVAGENNKDVIQLMATVIHGSEVLTPARQEILIATAGEVLGAAADVGADRRAHATQHLREYLPEVVDSAELMTDEQFAVVNAGFRWALQNYAAIPAITDKDRKTARLSVAGLKEGIVKFVDQSYLDTPQTVRKDLAAKAIERLGTIEEQVGNYFHPQLLYPGKKSLTADDVVRLLKGGPFLENTATQYAPIAKIQADESLPQGSRDVHVVAFLNAESFKIFSSLHRATAELFSEDAPTGYQPPSPKYMADKVQLIKELHAATEKRFEQEARNRLLARYYGKRPPELAITDARGVPKTVKLADYRGKWVLIDFWGLSCGPCIKSLPKLANFYEKHAADRDRFEILAICNDWDDVKTMKEFDALAEPIIKDHWDGKPLPFPVLLDGNGETLEAYGIDSVPTQVLIDPEGNLVKDGNKVMLAKKLKLPKP